MRREFSKLSDDTLAILKEQELFKNVLVDDLVATFTRFEDLHLLKDELAFRKGERYHKGIYILLNGKLILSRPNSNLQIVCENEAFGLSTFLGKTMYTMNAIAETDCDLLFVHELCIYRLMELSETFRKHLVKSTQKRLSELNNSGSFLLSSSYKSVASCMSTPLITLQTGKSVEEASRLMSEHKIGSLLVVNRKQIVKGLLTSKHLVARFMSGLEQNIKNLEVERYMDVNPITFPPEYPIVEALNELQLANASHALIIKHGKPAGIISISDISKILFENSNMFCTHLASVSKIEDLKSPFASLYLVVKTLGTTSRISREVLSALSGVHLSLQSQVFKITSAKFVKERNFNIADYHYCLLIQGAGARRELDLFPIVHNGFILDDDIDGKTVEIFKDFAELFSQNLVEVGYNQNICQNRMTGLSNVMHKKEWLATIDSWGDKGHPQGKNCFSCMMDAAAFDGDITLAWDIRNYMLERVQNKPNILLQLLDVDKPIKVPVSQFGSFIVEKDGQYKNMFDLHARALHYITNTTRLLSVYAGINDLSTVERIEHLARKRIISNEMAVQAIIAFDTIIETLINEQVNQSINSQPITSYIDPLSLSLFYQEKLKRALHYITLYSSYGISFLKNI